jgi:hypothetical protein
LPNTSPRWPCPVITMNWKNLCSSVIVNFWKARHSVGPDRARALCSFCVFELIFKA